MRVVIEAIYVDSTEKASIFNVQVKQGLFPAAAGNCILSTHNPPAHTETKTFIYCHAEWMSIHSEDEQEKNEVCW